MKMHACRYDEKWQGNAAKRRAIYKQTDQMNLMTGANRGP